MRYNSEYIHRFLLDTEELIGNCVDLALGADLSSSQTRTTGSSITGIGEFDIECRRVILHPANDRMPYLCSLKWHYEVFRWFDEFVGAKATSN